MTEFNHLRRSVRTAIAWIVILNHTLCLPVFAEEMHMECTPDQEEYIWEYLLDLTGNPKAAAGIMGNLYYESHLLPQKLEDGAGWDDSEDAYTMAVDCGDYDAFSTDGYGYGLAQWSYSQRKQRLTELAASSNASVGDLDVQLQLIAEELEKFNMLYRISHTDRVRFASDYFLLNFENPQDQDEQMQKHRAELGQSFYEKYTQQ